MEHTEELHPLPSLIRTEIRLENSKTWIEEETGPDFLEAATEFML